MMQLLPAVLCLLLVVQSLAAQIYGNEWIDYDQPYFKLTVKDDGLVRVDLAELASVLVPAWYLLADLDPRNFQLFHEGQ